MLVFESPRPGVSKELASCALLFVLLECVRGS